MRSFQSTNRRRKSPNSLIGQTKRQGPGKRLGWIVSTPQMHMLRSQPLLPQHVALFRERVFTGVIELRGGREGGPCATLTGVLITGGLDADMHTG